MKVTATAEAATVNRHTGLGYTKVKQQMEKNKSLRGRVKRLFSFNYQKQAMKKVA